MFAMMDLAKLYKQFLIGLEKIYDKGEAKAITDLIFKDVGFITNERFLEEYKSLTEAEVVRLQGYLESLKQHTPVQYVLGYTWFHNLKFKVTPDTLIPRPETEELVQHAFQFLKDLQAPGVIDIGCGSGCIPVTLKKKLPHAEIDAIDISEEALRVARENALMNNVVVNFIQQDFLTQENNHSAKKYDCIISNPPYIPKSQINKLDKNVSEHEPHTALFVPDNHPLIFYECIAQFANNHLENNGKGFVEINDSFADEVAQLFKIKGFNATIVKDIFGNRRFVHFIHCR